MADLITRALAIDIIVDMRGLCRNDVLCDAMKKINAISSVDAVPITWLKAHSREYCEDWGEEPVTVENALAMWQKEQVTKA